LRLVLERIFKQAERTQIAAQAKVRAGCSIKDINFGIRRRCVPHCRFPPEIRVWLNHPKNAR
jgi:hypothetical protein